jgi:hypothetical protein
MKKKTAKLADSKNFAREANLLSRTSIRFRTLIIHTLSLWLWLIRNVLCTF